MHATTTKCDEGASSTAERACLRHFLGVEVDDAGYEALLHDDLPHRLPSSIALAQQRADRLERRLDHFRWVVERAHLHQVLLLDAANR